MQFWFLWLLFLSGCLGFSIEGTWQSKSKTVITGPKFYDPIDELIYEPSLPGICYSFDKDGNWEQAIYQVEANPVNPTQPTATIIWQHGKYKMNKDKSLTLTPYPSDGRKLFSDPSRTDYAIYMRYNEVEKIDHYDVEYDRYNGKYRLQMYGFDGTKKQPLWLEYRPPEMLPTEVLNPTNKKDKDSLKNMNLRLKRSIDNRDVKMKRSDKIDEYVFHMLAVCVLLCTSVILYFLVKKILQTRRQRKWSQKKN